MILQHICTPLQRYIISLLLILSLAQPVWALPNGGQINSGQGSINTDGSTMNINQDSQNLSINWNGFSIAPGQTVNFQQPNASAVALNRITGQDPSNIFGNLNANGQVFLLNPNGVLFGAGSQVNVGGLVATSLQLSDEDFLNGNYRFTDSGTDASVINQGQINVAQGSFAALFGPQVSSTGIINARLGSVMLASGKAATLDFRGDGLLQVTVDDPSALGLSENNGTISADGGIVQLTAGSRDDLLAGSVNNSGLIEANQIIEQDGAIILGQVELEGKTIENSGQINASAGDVNIHAASSIDLGGSINVDADENGDGGNIIAFADLNNPDSRTIVTGALSARGGSQSGDGGFIETSASHLKIEDSADINTSAANGRFGQWLLDPYDFTIAAAGGDITGAALGTALNNTSVTIETLAGSVSCTGVACGAGDAAGNGDIFVNDDISWNSGAPGFETTLTLSAYRNIEINADISPGANDFMGGEDCVELFYATGGTGGYKIAVGLSNNGLGTVYDGFAPNNIWVDTTTAYTNPGFVSGVLTDVWLRLITGSSIYGDTPSFFYKFYDNTSAGSEVVLTPATGSISWDTDLTSTSNAGSYNLTYDGNFTHGSYNILAGDAVSWEILTRSIDLSVGKTYDGSADFTGGYTLTGAVNGNTVTASGTATVSSKNAGAYNSFTVAPTLNDSNYTLTGGTIAAQINQKVLTVSGITAADKEYDGTTSAVVDVSGVTLNGLIAGDLLNVAATGSFSDAQVGINKLVTLASNYSGADENNYNITGQASTTADINAASSSTPATPDSDNDPANTNDGTTQTPQPTEPATDTTDNGQTQTQGDTPSGDQQGGDKSLDGLVEIKEDGESTGGSNKEDTSDNHEGADAPSIPDSTQPLTTAEIAQGILSLESRRAGLANQINPIRQSFGRPYSGENFEAGKKISQAEYEQAKSEYAAIGKFNMSDEGGLEKMKLVFSIGDKIKGYEAAQAKKEHDELGKQLDKQYAELAAKGEPEKEEKTVSRENIDYLNWESEFGHDQNGQRNREITQIGSMLGAKVVKNSHENSYTLVKGEVVVKFTLGKPYMERNGKRIPLKTVPRTVIEYKTFSSNKYDVMSVGLIAEAFGTKIKNGNLTKSPAVTPSPVLPPPPPPPAETPPVVSPPVVTPPVVTPPAVTPSPVLPPPPPPPAETPPAETPPVVTPPAQSRGGQNAPSGNAISATTGLPKGATASYVDNQNNPSAQNATPPPGTTVANTAVRVTGIQNASATVAVKLPGASAGLQIGRLNESAGTWEVVGVVEANGKFTPPDDGVYTILK